MTFCRVAVSLRGPGRSPVLPFACCVWLPRSVTRCSRCSRWCRLHVRGAQLLVRGCTGCCGGRLTVFAAHAPPSPTSRLAALCARVPGAPLLHTLYRPSTPCAPLCGSRVRMMRSVMVAGGMRSVMIDAGGASPARCPGCFTLHGGRAVVLGSAHPRFVGGSFPSLDHHSFPQGAAGAPVVAHWVPDPLGTGDQQHCPAGAPGLAL